MGERIFETLEPVRRRQLRPARSSAAAAIGLLAGSLAGVALGVVRWQGRRGQPPVWSPASSCWRGPLLGRLFGLLRGRALRARRRRRSTPLRPQGPRRSPRSTSSVAAEPTPLHELQVADAEQHLAGSTRAGSRRSASRPSCPTRWRAAVAALALLLWPRPTPVQAEPGRAARSGRGRGRRRRGEPRRPRGSWPRRRTTPSSRSWSRSSTRRSRR